ncbi:MAG TPA: GNAT family N-acetyltransferase [Ideonella sp.]|uniref:GNAT family N-acetyltransferase n=1 Tax=Ideonella sp. TaxID=1929293 RepID=UPI002C8CA3EB|nr:GNAT family N-acetyltransferase [Ideonella sp.]HSI48701.1 GNAT family N-acetyltransferase [Ideonella sp.]
MTTLTTARLRLEPFTDSHVAGLNALNADPEVMRYISGRPETMEETVAVVQRVKQRWVEIGYSWWSFIDPASGEVVGAGCLQNLRREESLHPDPACPLELGWRLRRDHWGRGLATEAAQAIACFAFDDLHASELYAVCEPANTASANVMKRLGMQFRGLQRWYGKDLSTYSMKRG